MDFYDLSAAHNFANNLHNSNAVKVPHLKPLILSAPSYFHRRSRRSLLAHANFASYKVLRCPLKRGFIFEWPQKQKIYSERELCFIGWFIAHALYWLHIIHILPTGTGLDLNQPPWRYKKPLPKPENRDYIIEPDWDSNYH